MGFVDDFDVQGLACDELLSIVSDFSRVEADVALAIAAFAKCNDGLGVVLQTTPQSLHVPASATVTWKPVCTPGPAPIVPDKAAAVAECGEIFRHLSVHGPRSSKLVETQPESFVPEPRKG